MKHSAEVLHVGAWKACCNSMRTTSYRLEAAKHSAVQGDLKQQSTQPFKASCV
jgi:hypothetical protein